MSRVAAGEVIVEKPSNNMYTVLLAVAFLAQLVAFLAIYFKAAAVFKEGSSLFN